MNLEVEENNQATFASLQLNQALLDQLPVIFRRLNDELVEDRCFELLIQLLQDSDPHLKVSQSNKQTIHAQHFLRIRTLAN